MFALAVVTGALFLLTAYAAVVYLRASINLNTHIHLVVAKTPVAPIRSYVTIPRLELGRFVGTIVAMDSSVAEFGFSSSVHLIELFDGPSLDCRMSLSLDGICGQLRISHTTL